MTTDAIIMMPNAITKPLSFPLRIIYGTVYREAIHRRREPLPRSSPTPWIFIRHAAIQPGDDKSDRVLLPTDKSKWAISLPFAIFFSAQNAFGMSSNMARKAVVSEIPPRTDEA
uniref:Uncharacterized protein n=1 Tax=Candidatus Kentrum sp. SD TaxID=2126332 RepID=A0A450YKB8_9GAMM|nr:MAG: hypothetical protein BECKSD772E_GA0070983_100939 [Candidatus Kentron sp. SD]VFK41956.1 MAG: hypothetical protein BECKSD772F_GA0070984_110911 [Candidatus Kentron sp. SD]VFK78884.1 MAG: hypothetical protein BECKSD772D_GA0070982_102823 [Candidatus Kentron sp. SD]